MEDNEWQTPPLTDYIIYELHTGTFTPEGAFEGIETKLNYLKDLGITAIEIMPVAQFPGDRNWGYDGVFPFAVQSSYGGAEELMKLVDACHQRGLAVILDVVYNHLGPEGNYFNEFGPYFTEKYNTPWGNAINFDDAGCDEVRSYFIQNVLMWFKILELMHCVWTQYTPLKTLARNIFYRKCGRLLIYLWLKPGAPITLLLNLT
jgi:maltooligosyltrehalose trehalohydrolase